jgi:hypothetical protein
VTTGGADVERDPWIRRVAEIGVEEATLLVAMALIATGLSAWSWSAAALAVRRDLHLGQSPATGGIRDPGTAHGAPTTATAHVTA